MTDYSVYRKFYVDTGVFSLNSEPYMGYVETYNGIPSVFLPTQSQGCSNVVTDKQQLDSTNTYRSDLLTSNIFFDRLVDDQISLPNNIDDIIIQANDFLSEEVINKKISLLKENNTYCFSRLFIPNNNIPASQPVYGSFTSLSSSEFTVLSSYAEILPFSDSSIPDFSGIRGIACSNREQDETEFIMFAYTDTRLITLSGANNSLKLLSNSNLYQDNIDENTLTYGYIGGICIQDNNLFVTDSANNAVLKYDISSYTRNDTVFKSSKQLIEVIGSKGRVTDNYKFNTPTLITSSSTNIFVYDSLNYTIKVYDLNFNYITRINVVNFKAEKIIALEYNKINNSLYILTQPITGNLKLYVVNTSFIVVDSYTLDTKLIAGEFVRNISFSYNDSNIFYICTNFNVYKKLVNRPDKVIGRFRADRMYKVLDVQNAAASNVWNYVQIPYDNCVFKWNLLGTSTGSESGLTGSDDNRGMYITPQSSNSDKLFLITGSRIYFFNEGMTYKRVLKAENIDNYGRENLRLYGTEYVQASSLNKEIYKLITDIFLLKNNIRGRFYGTYDSQGILVLQDYNYNLNYNDFIDTTIENFFIHENEKGITGTINRVLTRIYDLQLKLIELTETDKGDSYLPVFNSTSLQPSNVLII